MQGWSESIGASTLMERTQSSRRVMRTSRQWPAWCVAPVTCCTRLCRSRAWLNLVVAGSVVTSKWMFKSPAIISDDAYVADCSLKHSFLFAWIILLTSTQHHCKVWDVFYEPPGINGLRSLVDWSYKWYSPGQCFRTYFISLVYQWPNRMLHTTLRYLPICRWC